MKRFTHCEWCVAVECAHALCRSACVSRKNLPLSEANKLAGMLFSSIMYQLSVLDFQLGPQFSALSLSVLQDWIS